MTTPSLRPAATQAAQFTDLDGLRGIAILLVLGAHGHLPGLRLGLFGVDVFFVLSGYLITRNLLPWTSQAASVATTARAYGVFLLRRAIRLVPAFAGALVLLTGWALLWPTDNALRCGLLAATYTMNLPLAGAGHCAGPWHVMWSLAAEQQFYLVWPWCLLLLARLRPRRAWRLLLLAYLLITATTTATALLVPGTAVWLNYSPAGRPVALLLGAALAIRLSHHKALRVPRPGWSALALGAGLALISVALELSLAPQVVLAPLAAVTTTALVASLRSRTSSRTARGLSARWLTFLGRISYSLYLVHLLTFYVARQLLPGHDLVAGLVGVASGLVLAYGLHHLVEEPARRRGNAALRRHQLRRRQLRRPAASPTATPYPDAPERSLVDA